MLAIIMGLLSFVAQADRNIDIEIQLLGGKLQNAEQIEAEAYSKATVPVVCGTYKKGFKGVPFYYPHDHLEELSVVREANTLKITGTAKNGGICRYKISRLTIDFRWEDGDREKLTFFRSKNDGDVIVDERTKVIACVDAPLNHSSETVWKCAADDQPAAGHLGFHLEDSSDDVVMKFQLEN